MTHAEADDNLIGTREAADMLGVSPRTVHRLVHAGALAAAHTAPGGPHGAFLFKADAIASRLEHTLTPAPDYDALPLEATP